MKNITQEELFRLGFSIKHTSVLEYYYFKEVKDVDMTPDDWCEVIVSSGNGTGEGYWSVGFRRRHGGLSMSAHNVTLRHGINDIQKIKDFINWMEDHSE